MSEILDQAAGAEETADQTAKDRADKDQKADDVVGEFEVPAADDCLQGADGTGSGSAGAGVAVKPRHAEVFQFPGVDFSSDKAGNVGVCEGSPGGLDEMTRPVPDAFLLIQCRYTPYRY